MDTVLSSFSAVFLILLMVLTGYIFSAKKWAGKEHKDLIVKIIVNRAVPCMCIPNITVSFDIDMLTQSFSLLLVPILAVVITALLAVLLAYILKIEKRRFGGFAVMCGLSNSLFIGLPMCSELFGNEAVPFVMFYYMVNTFVFWTLGAVLLYKSGSLKSKFGTKQVLKSLANPPLITLIIALLLAIFKVEVPHIAMRFCEYMGALVSPLALFFVGMVIYEIGFKKEFKAQFKDMVLVLLMRFLISPLIMLVFCNIFGISGIAKGVFIIESAMPVMTQSVVVSTKAGADDAYTAMGMSITTVACFAAIPLLMIFAV